MRRLLVKIGYFACIFLMLVLALDYFISYNLKYAFSKSSQVWNDIIDQKINDSCLIYGSSRAEFHFNPYTIEDSLHIGCYNLGTQAARLDPILIRHKVNLDYNPFPKWIIFSLDSQTLVDQNFLPYGDQYLAYLPWNCTITENVYTFFKPSAYLLPLYRYIDKTNLIKKSLVSFLYSLKHGKRQFYSDKGYLSIPMNLSHLSREESTFENEYDNPDEYKIDIGMTNKLDSFIKECKENNTKLMFVYTPEYIKFQEAILNRAEIIQTYKTLCENNDLIFLDYSNDSMSYKREYFADKYHLNTNGSQAFTELFIKDLKQLNFFENK